jgi:hypothetical protein
MEKRSFERSETEPEAEGIRTKGGPRPILRTSALIKQAFRENDTTPTLIRDIPTECQIETEYGRQVVETEPINVKFNSVNVFIGKKGTGKTACALNEVLKISLTGIYHMFIYVCPQGIINDDSFKALRPLIEENLCVQVVSTDEIVNHIDQLIRYKVIYEDIKKARQEKHLDPQQKEELFDALKIKDWHFKNLYTLIMFDDISGSPLFQHENSYMCSLLRRVRQPKLTIFLLIQNWKGLNPSVKNEITAIFMFKGFNQQQLQHIYSQSSVLARQIFIELANSLSKINDYCCIKIETDSGEMSLLRL